MVCAFGDLKTLKGSDNLYRCPLCTDLLFPPTDSLTKVEKHFTAQHWFKKIPFKGKKLLEIKFFFAMTAECYHHRQAVFGK